jgi:hypothetical protein
VVSVTDPYGRILGFLDRVSLLRVFNSFSNVKLNSVAGVRASARLSAKLVPTFVDSGQCDGSLRP